MFLLAAASACACAPPPTPKDVVGRAEPGQGAPCPGSARPTTSFGVGGGAHAQAEAAARRNMRDDSWCGEGRVCLTEQMPAYNLSWKTLSSLIPSLTMPAGLF